MEVMSAGITGLGGQWRVGLTRDVTHLFALGPGSDKYETAMHYQESTGIKVLLPHWFDDTMRLGTRLLPTKHYEWPEPGLLQPTPEDGKPHPEEERGRILDQYRQQLLKIVRWSESDGVPQSKENRNIWNGKRILLSSTLNLMPTTRDAIIAGTIRLGGKFVELYTRDGMGSLREESEKIEEADIYITRYRVGSAYAKVIPSLVSSSFLVKTMM
jgi:mediator of DNA damage checkpoint protein 1